MGEDAAGDAGDPRLGVVEAVRRACRATDGHDPLDEAADLRLRHHGLAGGELRVEEDVGFALVTDGDLLLAVAPEARGQGVGATLAAAAVGSAERAWSHGDHPAAAALARRHGWAHARDLWVMRRPASEPLPPLVVPDGVRIRGYHDDDADALLTVNAAAFATHPEQGTLDRAGLAERTAEPWFEPPGLLMALDSDGSLLGFHWTKRHDAATGEVYVVAVAPQAQGRGLGRALTLAGLHHLADAGVAEVLLHVESDNAAAVHVYAELGFAHAPTDTHVQYLRPTGG